MRITLAINQILK